MEGWMPSMLIHPLPPLPLPSVLRVPEHLVCDPTCHLVPCLLTSPSCTTLWHLSRGSPIFV
ncbi:hypothetical protein E2320_009449, partial [Naja naja]